MKKILGLCLVLGLVGCASPKYNYQATPQQISKPPLGSTNTVSVGDKLLTQGIFTEREAIQVFKPVKAGSYTIEQGYYLKTGDDQKAQYYKAVNTIPNGGSVQRGFLSDPFKAVMLTSDGKLCVIGISNAYSCNDEHDAKVTTVGVAEDNSFQQTLIYSGRIGNKINIAYREYSSNLARPAFNNDVEYDLATSKEIGYKGALLEVVDATNQSITYKVLKNFNKE